MFIYLLTLLMSCLAFLLIFLFLFLPETISSRGYMTRKKWSH